MNIFQKAKEYDKILVKYNSIIDKNQSLEKSLFATVYKPNSQTYKDAIQDMQALIVRYQENPAMLATIAPIIEYLKESYIERRKSHASVKKKQVQKVGKKLLVKQNKK